MQSSTTRISVLIDTERGSKGSKGIENKTRIDPSFASMAGQLHYNILFSVIIIIIKFATNGEHLTSEDYFISAERKRPHTRAKYLEKTKKQWLEAKKGELDAM